MPARHPAPPRRSRRGPAASAALLCVLALAGCTGAGADTSSGTQRFVAGDGVVHFVEVQARQPGPPLDGETLDGDRLDAASLGDGPLVVNVWGSWCAPCKSEQPALERIARARRSEGVRFLGINVRDSGRTSPQRHVKNYGVTYPSLYDPAGRLLPRFEIAPRTIPTTYVLDADRRIAAYVFGEVQEKALDDLIRRVLAERAE